MSNQTTADPDKSRTVNTTWTSERQKPQKQCRRPSGPPWTQYIYYPRLHQLIMTNWYPHFLIVPFVVVAKKPMRSCFTWLLHVLLLFVRFQQHDMTVHILTLKLWPLGLCSHICNDKQQHHIVTKHQESLLYWKLLWSNRYMQNASVLYGSPRQRTCAECNGLLKNKLVVLSGGQTKYWWHCFSTSLLITLIFQHLLCISQYAVKNQYVLLFFLPISTF